MQSLAANLCQTHQRSYDDTHSGVTQRCRFCKGQALRGLLDREQQVDPQTCTS